MLNRWTHKTKKLAALGVTACLLLTLVPPVSFGQGKQDAADRKREAIRHLNRAAEPVVPDLTDAVNQKKADKGKPSVQSGAGTNALAAPRANALAAPNGVAESVVSSGRASSGSGTAAPREAFGPVYEKVPELTPEQAEAMHREFEEANPVVVVPPGSGKKILDMPPDPPSVPFAQGLAPVADRVDAPQKLSKEGKSAVTNQFAPTDFVYATVRDIPQNVVSQRSTVGEPSLGNMGNTIFYTGNWYAARSSDGGATFTYVSPFTTFPSINRGFCCDQLANYAPAQDMMLWALQYVSDGSSGTLRLARAVGSSSVLNNQWVYYDFNPQKFGFATGTWMDFPVMTVASSFVYLSSNVFNSSDRFVGSVVWRVPLTELAAGGQINYNYFKRTDDGSPRLTEGATTTMYWATHVNTSTIRIFRWDDSSTDIFWNDVNHNPFTYLARDGVATSPDGTNWAARADSRILGAWVANGVLGFMWGAKQNSTFPYPYTIIARFNQNTRALISQNNIWHQDFAWLLPTASVNASGNVAGLLVYGGGQHYPSPSIWISDDVQNGFSPLAIYGAAQSTSGPTRNSWGDYHTVRPHKTSPNSWVASTYYMQNGGSDSNTVPRYLWFGRERDLGCSFTISPTSQDFGSNGGTGNVTVTASSSSCVRTATSNASWLTITSGASSTGNGTVSYSVAANSSSTPRTGTMTIAGRTFTVNQSGSTCSYSILPTSNSVGAGAASGSVGVTAGTGCGWTAVSNVSWLSVTSGASGTGNGTVNYSVSANTGNVSRNGTITIAGRTFTVTQSAAASGGCTTSSISSGQTVNGNLSTSDCKLTDDSFYDPYTFSGTAGQQVVVSMSSTSFDTYLFLLGPGGTVVASNDDGGGGTNSRIPPSGTFNLPTTGTYTILANSFAPGVTGSYTLTLSLNQTCTTVGINPGQTVGGTLSGTDCQLSDGSYYDTYTFSGSAGQQATISMSSALFDTYLFILTPDGVILSTDDDGGGGTNSRIPPSGTLTLPATGSYSILANSFYGGVTGSYTLTLTLSTGPTVQLSQTNFNTNEADQKVTINVTRGGNTSAPASVDFDTADSSADRRGDYIQTPGTLNFAAGETTKQITIFITDDTYQEAQETFILTLSNAKGLTLGSPLSATVTINSNDTTPGPNPVVNSSFNSSFFVRQHYVDFLNRDPDSAGLNFWIGQTTGCGNIDLLVCRINVSAAFFVSPEFQETGFYVIRMQRTSFGKKSDSQTERIGITQFLRDARQVGAGFVDQQPGAPQVLEANKQAYATQVVSSADFITRYPTALSATQFVDALIGTAGAGITSNERQQAINAYNGAGGGTAGRVAALRSLTDSTSLRDAEFRGAFVLMQYFGYLRRDPDQPGYAFWLGKLNQFNGNYITAEMVKAFITSGEYIQRFGPTQ